MASLLVLDKCPLHSRRIQKDLCFLRPSRESPADLKPGLVNLITIISEYNMSKPGTPTSSNTLLLRRQLTELTKRPVEGFSAGL